MNKELLGWMGGMVDGEGTVTISKAWTVFQ